MKRITVFSTFIVLFISILLSSCRKENTESGSVIDTIKTEVSQTLEKNDTAGITWKDESTAKKEKADSIPKFNVKNEKETSSLKSDTKDKIKVIAYYFHPTARCPTCINIENFAREVIDTKFSKEKNKGLLTFSEVNIEDSVNEHFIEDYELTSSSLVLVMYNNNKQVKWKNLEKVWKFANSKEEYFAYAKIELSQFLKETNTDNFQKKVELQQ